VRSSEVCKLQTVPLWGHVGTHCASLFEHARTGVLSWCTIDEANDVFQDAQKRPATKNYFCEASFTSAVVPAFAVHVLDATSLDLRAGYPVTQAPPHDAISGARSSCCDPCWIREYRGFVVRNWIIDARLWRNACT